jgi:hypothetical protein
MTMQAGVTISARANAWRGIPDNLASEVTPILVTLTNDGKASLLLRYSEFKLVSSSGQQFAALPPFDIKENISQPIDPLAYPPIGFRVAPYLSPFYPGLVPFSGPFASARWYYNHYYPTWVRIHLPTTNMLQKALPEGVLESGGRITGFLYFENVGDDVARVDFMADLVSARDGARVATLSLPLLVEARL